MSNTEAEFEKSLVELGLTAPRLTPSLIDSLIADVQYHQFPGTTTTTCCITLVNGDSVTGESGCVSPENFNAQKGQEAAFEQARDKIWRIAGAILKDALAYYHTQDTSIFTALKQDPVIQKAFASMDDTYEWVASVAHEVNRSYCIGLGDNSQLIWEDAPEWQRTSAINVVRFLAENLDATPENTHESWLRDKEADGWRYGPVKDAEKKEHPCFLPYAELPAEQRIKDHLFRTIVRLLV